MSALPQLLLNGVIAGCGFGLMAMSFALIYRLAHFFHFSHGAAFTLGAYTAYWVSFDRRPIVASMAAVILTGLLGGALECLLYRPLRKRRASSVVLLVASIGCLVAIQNIIAAFFGDEVRLLIPSSGKEGLRIGPAYITSIQIMTVSISILLCILTALVLRLTSIGRTLRAIECDEQLAEIMGVNVSVATLCMFVVGSILAGTAGILAASDTGLRPTMGFQALLLGVVAMIVGGSGGVLSSFLGGLSIGLVQQLSSLFMDSKWQDAAVFLILSIFLLLRPHGFRASFVMRPD